MVPITFRPFDRDLAMESSCYQSREDWIVLKIHVQSASFSRITQNLHRIGWLQCIPDRRNQREINRFHAILGSI